MRHRLRRELPAHGSAHRKALLRNLSASLITNGQILTTTAKAKALRPHVERLITAAVQADKSFTPARRLARIRVLKSRLSDPAALHILLQVLGKVFAARPGGYTRIVKAGFRQGDGSEMSVIALVVENSPFDDLVPATRDVAQLTAAERYKHLKDYSFTNLTHAKFVLNRWVNYEFPAFSITVSRADSNVFRTTVSLQNDQRWSVADWPRVGDRVATLSLTLHFMLAGGEGLPQSGDARWTARIAAHSDEVNPFPGDGSRRVFPFAIVPAGKYVLPSLIVEHTFLGQAPGRVFVSLSGPYSTLQTAWLEMGNDPAERGASGR